MRVLYGQQARAVGALLSEADPRQRLRRFLRHEEAALMPPERQEALEILVRICRDGYIPVDTTIARARARLAFS